ncbi:MAG: ATP-binding protein, partial [Gemmataceae bacterium]
MSAPEKMEFRTELKQLLHLITHSLYSNKRVFLRELVSNASDAIHKLRFDSLDSEALLENDKDFKIHLIPDAKRGRLVIRDNGIGMSRATVIENLGTVARSGTKAYLEKVKEATAANRPDLIGQFGVGFYSAFMVADQVEVISRQAGDPADAGVRWVSDGQGDFTVEPVNRPSRGTEVILHLKEEDKDEFTNPYTLEHIVKQFSDFIEIPVVLHAEKPQDEKEADKAPEIEQRV